MVVRSQDHMVQQQRENMFDTLWTSQDKTDGNDLLVKTLVILKVLKSSIN